MWRGWPGLFLCHCYAVLPPTSSIWHCRAVCLNIWGEFVFTAWTLDKKFFTARKCKDAVAQYPMSTDTRFPVPRLMLVRHMCRFFSFLSLGGMTDNLLLLHFLFLFSWLSVQYTRTHLTTSSCPGWLWADVRSKEKLSIRTVNPDDGTAPAPVLCVKYQSHAHPIRGVAL